MEALAAEFEVRADITEGSPQWAWIFAGGIASSIVARQLHGSVAGCELDEAACERLRKQIENLFQAAWSEWAKAGNAVKDPATSRRLPPRWTTTTPTPPDRTEIAPSRHGRRIAPAAFLFFQPENGASFNVETRKTWRR